MGVVKELHGWRQSQAFVSEPSRRQEWGDDTGGGSPEIGAGGGTGRFPSPEVLPPAASSSSKGLPPRAFHLPAGTAG